MTQVVNGKLIWTQKNGINIRLEDMSDQHVVNTYKMCKREVIHTSVWEADDTCFGFMPERIVKLHEAKQHLFDEIELRGLADRL